MNRTTALIPGVRGDEVGPPRDLGELRRQRGLQVESHLLAATSPGAVALLDVELAVVRADVEERRLHVEVGGVDLLLDARHLVRHGGSAEEVDGRYAAVPGELFNDVMRIRGSKIYT